MIGVHLARLRDLRSRETRAQFWPWVAVVVVATAIGTVLVMVPAAIVTLTRMRAFAAAHPELVTETAGPNGYEMRIDGWHPELMPDFGLLAAALGLVLAGAALLLAAAVARRLHDAGWPRWLGVLPLPFLAIGLFGMAGLGGGAEPGGRLFAGIVIANLGYLATLALLVALLCGPSRPAST